MLWFLENVNLFQLLCPHKYEAYKSNHQLCYFAKNDYVYFPEDAANKVFLIDSGKIKIGYYTENGDEVVKAILGKGELFGEKAFLGEEKRDEFAQAIDKETVVCPVPADTIGKLVVENKDFSISFYKFLGYRFKKLERRLQLLLFKDARTRLIEFLSELYSEHGHCCLDTGDSVIENPYTQKDIATLIGISRPTLNSMLQELKEENLINFNRKEIRLKEGVLAT